MKINMLGRDIMVTRQALLSDGYCLSTVKHAERLAQGPEVYTVSAPDGQSQGAVWLGGHILFCKQCKIANEVKNRITAYIGRHFPSRITDWHQGRMPGAMLGQIVSALMKSDQKFMSKAIENMSYNMRPLHLQAIEDRGYLIANLSDSDANHFSGFAEAARKSRVILVDTDVLFEAWQLLGSDPLYEKKRLVSDFEKFKIRTPFPSTYFAFSEGINRHLIEHFFDNMPAELFGGSSIKGVLFSISESQAVIMEYDILSDPALDIAGEDPATVSRSFLWAALVRAIQDKVFAANLAPESEKERDQYLRASGQRRTKAPEPFYVVRVNPNSAFRDEARSYGKRHINWTHRWEVAGHWRTYQDGKRVWIASYVKGPEDKPFVPAVRVYGEEVAVQARENMGRLLLNRFMAWVRSFRKPKGV